MLQLRWRDVLDEHIAAIVPDLVIIGFCVNDPQPRDQSYAAEIERYRFLFDRFRDFGSFGFKRTSGFLRDRVDQALRNLGLVPQWPEALDRTYLPESEEWRNFRIALSDMVEICKKNDVSPPVFVPLLQFDGDYSDPTPLLVYVLRWTKLAAIAASEEGLNVIDLHEIFLGQGYQTRSVNRWDQHPGQECNKIYADAIASHLSTHNLLTKINGTEATAKSALEGAPR